eukprot:Rhum_TRINITY_DN25060_c0_g1::Rhum_TRINITY_DN25060_c0_g1_i1::g.181074::m.181074
MSVTAAPPQRVYVKAQEPYVRFNDGQHAIYACRLVQKTSSKGKQQRRELVLTKHHLVLAEKTNVRRLIDLKDLAEACVQKRGGKVYILIRSSQRVEPDILFTQIEPLERPPPSGSDGQDLLQLISSLRGNALPVRDLSSSAPLTEKNCHLQKTSGFDPPKWKLEEIVRRRAEDEKEKEKEKEKEREKEQDVTARAAPIAAPLPVLQPTAPPIAVSQKAPLSATIPVGGRSHPLNKCLCIAAAYPETDFSLPMAAHDARMMVRVLEALGFFTPPAPTSGKPFTETHMGGFSQDTYRFLTDSDVGSASPTRSRTLLPPTRANITASIDWLMNGCVPGDNLILIFVGHCLSQTPPEVGSLRDGAGEALYPSDCAEHGVLTERELTSRIVPHMKPGVSLTVICDSCNSGCLLDLPYKLKTKMDGTLQSTMDPAHPGPLAQGHIVQISGYKGTVAPPPDASQPQPSATGGVIAGLCAALTTMSGSHPAGPAGAELASTSSFGGQGFVGRAAGTGLMRYSATFEDMVSKMRQTVLALHGLGGQVPMISASAVCNSQDHFFSVLLDGSGLAALEETISVADARHGRGSPSRRRTGGSLPRVGPEALSPPATPAPATPALAAGAGATLQPLPPAVLRLKIPHSVLGSPGLAKLGGESRGGPEIFFAAEVIHVEVRCLDPAVPQESSEVAVWPTAKILIVGRDTLYLLEPNGDVDRCVPLHEISDFVLLRAGFPLHSVMLPQPSSVTTIVEGSRHPWLAARIPSQYELLFQPVEAPEGLSPQTHINQFLQVVNELKQHGPAALLGQGVNAKVLVLEKDGMLTPGLLRLLRPQSYRYPFVPLSVAVFPGDASPPGLAASPEAAAVTPAGLSPYSRRYGITTT